MSPLVPRPPAGREDLERLVRGEHTGPHGFLGCHETDGGWLVRAYRPGALRMHLLQDGAEPIEMERLHDAGAFSGGVGPSPLAAYRLRALYPDGGTDTFDDPYRFWPTVGEIDLHLLGEGRHHRLWDVMGARPITHQGVVGTAFALWAPNARAVSVAGDFNLWSNRQHPLRSMGASGVWELFIPGVSPGARYKFAVLNAGGDLTLKADPMATAAEVPPATASIVSGSNHRWEDREWLEARRARDPLSSPLSIYEVHLGSWRRIPEEADRPLTYRELAVQLADHVESLGFTHVELMPVAEHPFAGSWGYQVSSYYAPTSRFGPPDDFRALVDALHRRGIGVILDWVPAHFPRDEWALARLDGTALYEHDDPRRGAHHEWGTLVFNYGRNEVRNFLVANALYWLEEFHIDGLRVDGVSSMLYLDYNREAGEWLANEQGGRENTEAVAFLRELNETAYGAHPGIMLIAEESTAWPAVSRPIYA
ncbi:MAG: 1,4-alpha-glucan branching enzyme, partial [Candidatus Dormibacteria bacterium]